VITAGDTLAVRVEIWNVGNQDLFICKNFEGVRLVFCDLSLSFTPRAVAPRTEWAVDANPDENESFANALVRNWISIPPKHFYGMVVELDPSTYPELKTAGRYRIHGRYVSPGLLGSGYYNNLLEHSEEVSRLPGKSWQGDVDTNSAVIRVVGKRD
jgi:hypothetical protein